MRQNINFVNPPEWANLVHTPQQSKCMRQNKPQDIIESGNTKKCPYCRASSLFITPSSVFYAEGDSRKTEIIENYKASMARIPCKYVESLHSSFCGRCQLTSYI